MSTTGEFAGNSSGQTEASNTEYPRYVENVNSPTFVNRTVQFIGKAIQKLGAPLFCLLATLLAAILAFAVVGINSVFDSDNHRASAVSTTGSNGTYPPVISPAYQAPWGAAYIKDWAYNAPGICAEINQRVAQLSDGPGDFAAMDGGYCGLASFNAADQNEVDGKMVANTGKTTSYGDTCMSNLQQALWAVFGPSQNTVKTGQATLACYGPDSSEYRVVANTGTYYDDLPPIMPPIGK